MGVASASFAKTAQSDGWLQLGRGPRLRRIFGAYGIQDCWAAQRRYRQIDDGRGYLSFDEFAKLIDAEDCSLLFIWDLFSQQNELMDVKELLTVVCFFSSAPLDDKARFLLSLFDKTKCSISTGVEVAQLLTMIFGILARCTGFAATKMKETSASLKEELPGLLKGYSDVVALAGSDAAFRDERCIHHSEVGLLTEPLRHAYERLSVSLPPPADSPPPPMPDWGMTEGSPQRPLVATPVPVSVVAKPRVGAGMSATLAPEAHLAWMSRVKDDPLPYCAAGPAVVESCRSWLLMHGVVFGSVATDLPRFRQGFVGAVRSSLGLSSARVEVASVMPGVSETSTVLELVIHPDAAGCDERPLPSLLRALEQQACCSHSALRKSPVGRYLLDAELLEGPLHRTAAAVPTAEAAPGPAG